MKLFNKPQQQSPSPSVRRPSSLKARDRMATGYPGSSSSDDEEEGDSDFHAALYRAATAAAKQARERTNTRTSTRPRRETRRSSMTAVEQALLNSPLKPEKRVTVSRFPGRTSDPIGRASVFGERGSNTSNDLDATNPTVATIVLRRAGTTQALVTPRKTSSSFDIVSNPNKSVSEVGRIPVMLPVVSGVLDEGTKALPQQQQQAENKYVRGEGEGEGEGEGGREGKGEREREAEEGDGGESGTDVELCFEDALMVRVPHLSEDDFTVPIVAQHARYGESSLVDMIKHWKRSCDAAVAHAKSHVMNGSAVPLSTLYTTREACLSIKEHSEDLARLHFQYAKRVKRFVVQMAEELLLQMKEQRINLEIQFKNEKARLKTRRKVLKSKKTMLKHAKKELKHAQIAVDHHTKGLSKTLFKAECIDRGLNESLRGFLFKKGKGKS